MSLVNITYDNTRTDILKYDGLWTHNESYNASNFGETGILSLTTDLTANVSFTIPQSASAFYFYGMHRCCGGEYTIHIDSHSDGLDNNVRKIINAVNKTEDGKNPPAILFSKKFHTPGVHTITIVNRYDKRFGGNSELTLDRFVLQVESNALTLSQPLTLASPSYTSAASDPSHPDTETQSSKPPISAIVGGVLGGTVALCLIIWVLTRHRRRHTRNTYTVSPTAYTVTNPGSTSRKASEAFGSSASSPSSRRTHPPPSRVGMAYGGHLPRHEIDAGRIDVDAGDDFGTLPPQYEVVFGDGPINGDESATRGPNHRSPNRP